MRPIVTAGAIVVGKRDTTEKEFMGQVLDLARLWGWVAYHTHDSRRSAPGFPDLVLVHPKRKRLWFVELKTDAGRLTLDQERWVELLSAAGASVAVWRPSLWKMIEKELEW